MVENSSTKGVEITVVGKTGKMGTAIVALIDKDPRYLLSDLGEVVIDFSTPEGTLSAIAMEKPLVCGTTGLTETHFKQMEALAAKVPVLYCPNFSLGALLLFEIAAQFGPTFERFGDVTLEESHHATKKDTPSGTALKLSKLLHVEEIESTRSGETVGVHQINISFGDEQLTLRHETHSRRAFAKGALAAAQFLLDRPPRLYQISEIFD